MTSLRSNFSPARLPDYVIDAIIQEHQRYRKEMEQVEKEHKSMMIKLQDVALYTDTAENLKKTMISNATTYYESKSLVVEDGRIPGHVIDAIVEEHQRYKKENKRVNLKHIDWKMQLQDVALTTTTAEELKKAMTNVKQYD